MSRLATKIIPRLFLSLGWAVVALVGPDAPATAQTQTLSASSLLSFLNSPPLVERATIRLLEDPSDATPTLLQVLFAKDERIEKSVTLTLDDEPITLTDDGTGGDEKAGDGVFSAVIHFDAKAFALEQMRRQRLAEEGLTVPKFDQRAQVGIDKIRFFPPDQIKPGIDIDLAGFLGIAAAVDPERELLVHDVAVVNDPARTFDPCTGAGTPLGPWTFGFLMQQMANQPATGIDPAVFVRRWLKNWEANQTINGFPVAQRLNIQTQIINPWPKLPDGRLDLAHAPFRLLAIVNRIDLRQNLIYGGGSAGELRFVFGVVNLNQCLSNPNAGVLQFTTIFEYGVKKKNCPALHAYAKQWHDLGSLVLGSPAYNAALQAITDPVVKAGADPAKPNGSALNQLRTNEIALAAPWELREFNIVASGQLAEVTVKQTPDLSLNNQPVVRDFINVNEAAILAGTHVVPLDFPSGTPFLGGSALTPFGLFWNGPAAINNLEARHLFSLATCNGCHAGETNTVFTHVKPRPPGAPAALSDFLTGLNQPTPNPVPPPADHTFNDLGRRAQDLDALVNSGCVFRLFDRPLLMTH